MREKSPTLFLPSVAAQIGLRLYARRPWGTVSPAPPPAERTRTHACHHDSYCNSLVQSNRFVRPRNTESRRDKLIIIIIINLGLLEIIIFTNFTLIIWAIFEECFRYDFIDIWESANYGSLLDSKMATSASDCHHILALVCPGLWNLTIRCRI